ncbi:MAG TPA: polysaccharide biosynthesis C-terminal domain-containing protein, partial [Solirubrobacteraceae bacterium]
QLFTVLADAGLTTILMRELAQRPERAPALVGSALALRSALGLLALAGAAIAALALPYSPTVRLGVLIAGVPLVLGVLTSAFTAVALADLRGARVAVADVAGRATALAALAAVVALDLGFYAVIATAGAGAAVTLALAARLARPLLPAAPRGDRATARALLVAALPVGAALALNEAYFRADALIISLSRPYAELGRYALAWRVSELVSVFPGVLIVSVFPVLSRYMASGDGRLRGALQSAFDVFVVLALGIAAGGAIVAAELARTLGGEAFAGAAAPLRVLLCAAALACVNGLLGNALIARGAQIGALWLNGAALGLNVALNVALVPPYGIQAAAWTALGCEVVLLAGTAWLVRRRLGFVPGPAVLPRALVAALAMAAVLWPLRDAPVVLTVPLGALVFGAVALATRAVEVPRARPHGGDDPSDE